MFGYRSWCYRHCGVGVVPGGAKSGGAAPEIAVQETFLCKLSIGEVVDVVGGSGIREE